MGLRTRLSAQDDEYLGVATATLPCQPEHGPKMEAADHSIRRAVRGVHRSPGPMSTDTRVDRLDVILNLPNVTRRACADVATQQHSSPAPCTARYRLPRSTGRGFRGEGRPRGGPTSGLVRSRKTPSRGPLSWRLHMASAAAASMRLDSDTGPSGHLSAVGPDPAGHSLVRARRATGHWEAPVPDAWLWRLRCSRAEGSNANREGASRFRLVQSDQSSSGTSGSSPSPTLTAWIRRALRYGRGGDTVAVPGSTDSGLDPR